MRPAWIAFDIGGTLIDETRLWTVWAQVLSIAPGRMVEAMRAGLYSGEDHHELLTRLGGPDWRDRRAPTG